MFALRRLATTASRSTGRPAAALGLTRHARPQSLAELRTFESLLQTRFNSYDSQSSDDGRMDAYRRVGDNSQRPAWQQRPSNNPPSKVIYVGNLKYEVTEKDLEEKFREFGEIRGVRVPRTSETGIARGFAYIEFGSLEEAAEAMEAMHMAPFLGRRLNVQYVARTDLRIKNNPESKTLFIGNLSFNTTDDDLNELFKDVAGCVDVRVAMDRRTGQPRGFVHADFADVQSAVKAKEQLAGTQLYGRQIRIDYSVPPEERRRQFEERMNAEGAGAESSDEPMRSEAQAAETTEKPFSS